MGQGAQTALPNIAAEIMKTPPERVRLMPIDTNHTPFDQGTNASSGIAVMGQAVERAALDLGATKFVAHGDEAQMAAAACSLDFILVTLATQQKVDLCVEIKQ